MGEIVRVLKWRADWEAAGLTTGLEKAAADAEKLAAAAEKVGDRGTAGLEKTAEAAKKTDTAFAGLGLEAKQVEMYLSRLEKGAGSPLVLQRNAELAGAAMAVLAAKSEAAGTALDTAFTGRVEEAIRGAKEQAAGMNAELEKMGGQTPTKLDKVIVALEKTESSLRGTAEGARDAWGEFEKLGDEGKQVAEALRDLERTKDSPRALGVAVGLATFKLEEMQAKAKAMGPAGAAAMKQVEEATRKAEGAIKTANDRAGRMKDTFGDMGSAAKFSGDKLEGLRTTAGSLDGAFGRMRDTGTGVTKAIGSVGLAAGVAGAAISGAVATGHELANMIDAVSAKLAERDRKQVDSAIKAQLLDAANRAVTRGMMEQGKTTDETIRRYVEMTLKMGRLTEQGREYIATVAGMKAPAAWTEIERRAEAMVVTLEGAYKRSEEEGRRWTLANVQELKSVVAAYDEVGKKAPEALQKALSDAEKWAEGNRKAAEAARAVIPAVNELAASLGGLSTALAQTGDVATKLDAVAKALDAVKASGGDVGTVVGANMTAFMGLRTEAEKSYETLQKFRTEIMDQIPAYQATALAIQQYAGAFAELDKMTAATTEYEAARRAANEADLAAGAQLAALQAEAANAARSIDTIGEAWAKATGQAAGFTVEVRHQTKAVQEVSPEFESFIESLAGVSDQYERMTPYVGALIAQLEKGDITTAEFEKTINSLRVAFMQIQGVSGQMFGDIDTLFNKLTHLTNEFAAGERGRKK